jgi:predicted nucleic acid-binding protein
MIMVDADVFIDIRRGHPPAARWFDSLNELPCVPGPVAFELYQGCRNRDEIRKLGVFLAPFPLVWPTEEACERALTKFGPLHLSHRLGVLDALIAACAIGKEATLCTFNTKHFQALPDLVTLQPYTR